MHKWLLNIVLIILLFLLYGLLSLLFSGEAKASDWTSQTESKYQNLKSIGFPGEIAYNLIIECKKAKNPVNCIKIGASILGAESSKGTRCYRNNCVGMNDGAVPYLSKADGVREWVKKWDKYWYKQKTPSSFYRNDGIPPITHYCLGPNRDGVCKEGTKNSWEVFNSLNF